MSYIFSKCDISLQSVLNEAKIFNISFLWENFVNQVLIQKLIIKVKYPNNKFGENLIHLHKRKINFWKERVNIFINSFTPCDIIFS